MRRRRSALPFVVLGGLALVLGIGLAVIASSIQPTPDILSFLHGGASPTTAAIASGRTASAGSASREPSARPVATGGTGLSPRPSANASSAGATAASDGGASGDAS